MKNQYKLSFLGVEWNKMAWYPRLVSLRGAKRRGNLPVCHCEERSDVAICRYVIARSGATWQSAGMSLQGAEQRGNLTQGLTGDCHGRQSRPRNDSCRYKRLPRLADASLAMTYRSCRTPVSLRGAKRRGNLMLGFTGDCHGRQSRPRNDTFAAAMTFQCGKRKAPGFAGRPRGDEAIKRVPSR